MTAGRIFSWFIIVVLIAYPTTSAEVITDIGGGAGGYSGGTAPAVKSVNLVSPGPAVAPPKESGAMPAPGPWDEPLFSEKYPLPVEPTQQGEGGGQQQPPQLPLDKLMDLMKKKPPASKKPMEPKKPMEVTEQDCQITADSKNKEPTSSPCIKDGPCGTKVCEEVWKAQMMPCVSFKTMKPTYDAMPWMIPGPFGVPTLNQMKKTLQQQLNQLGKQCCEARKNSEKAKITTQQNPCIAKIGGGLLLGDNLDSCRPEILQSNCPITGKDQLQQLYNDRNFMKSLGQKDFNTVDNMIKNGIGKDGFTNIGDLDPRLQEMALQKAGASNPSVVGQGPPDGLSMKGYDTARTPQVSSFRPSDYAAGQTLTVSPGTGQVAGVGSSGATDIRSASAEIRSTPSSPSTYLTSSQSAEFVQDGWNSIDDVTFGTRIHGLQSSVSRTPSGYVFYEPAQIPIFVNFYPHDPPMATIFSLNIGQAVPGWIKVIPRVNAQIDFDGGDSWSSYATSVTQQMGIPKGSSLMANPANLNVKTLYTYYIDGLRDYDFLVSNGLVRWPLSGDPGGRIIASSFGIPPNQYLSKQQSEMVYG